MVSAVGALAAEAVSAAVISGIKAARTLRHVLSYDELHEKNDKK
jgi:L-aminopeptidase/D-esterase-like protein